MTGYLIRRIIQALITCIVVTIITFLLMHAVPNGLINLLVGSKNINNPVAKQQVINELGLNKPIVEQYFVWLNDLIHGRFGFDYYYEQNVSSLLAGALGQSMFIVGLALVITIVLAVPIGMIQALKRNTVVDHSFTTFSFVAYSIPTFLIGWLLLYYLSTVLGWLPSTTVQIASFNDAISNPAELILPVGTLVITQLANYTRYMRSAMLDQVTQDYVRTAIAKGASRGRVVYGHMLRNALIPMVTLVGLSLPALVSGALIIESVFNIHGIGLLTTNAAENNDPGITLDTTLLLAIFTVIGSLLADISYAVLDPRVRLNA